MLFLFPVWFSCNLLAGQAVLWFLWFCHAGFFPCCPLSGMQEDYSGYVTSFLGEGNAVLTSVGSRKALFNSNFV